MISLEQLIIGWFFYGVFYMGFSVAATWMLNRLFNRLIWAPLLINFFSVIVLLATYAYNKNNDQFWYNLFFVYMPIVASSVVTNLGFYLYKKVSNR